MKYESFKNNGYIFPPRPDVKCPAADLDKYDTGEYLAQPKYNGSACIVFTNGTDLHIYNRHKEYLSLFTKNHNQMQFKELATTKNWFVYAGEYLNKGKYGETGVKEKDKFVIWDILVYDGKYLIGSTLLERLDLLESIFPCERTRVGADAVEVYDHLCWTKLTGIYKAPTYLGKFKELYRSIVKTDLYEGLVLKKKHSKLAFGLQEKNNTDWQLKCRKETKNYSF